MSAEQKEHVWRVKNGCLSSPGHILDVQAELNLTHIFGMAEQILSSNQKEKFSSTNNFVPCFFLTNKTFDQNVCSF